MAYYYQLSLQDFKATFFLKFQGARYEEEVLKPREEAEKARLEEEFNKFAGPAWKGKSNRLGVSNNDQFINLTYSNCRFFYSRVFPPNYKL